MNPFRLLALLLLVAPCAGGPSDGDRPTLNVVVHGINSRGTDMYGEVGTLREQGTTWRIELVKDSRPTNDRSVIQYMNFAIGDPGADPQGTHVLRVRDPNDPKLKEFIGRIANEPHATVAIDMDLTVVFANPLERREEVSTWRHQTDAAATVAVELAEARAKARPDSENTILAHSAGTVALSKVIDAGRGSLFQTKVAASPMTWQLSSDVLILQAAGDLPSTPTGALGDLQLKGAAARDTDGWVNHGNTVVRVNPSGFNVHPSAVFNPIGAHTESHQLDVDHDVQVFVPVSTQKPGEPPSPMHVEKFEVSNVEPGRVMKTLENVGGAQGLGSSEAVAKLKQEVQKLQPPDGGGIALRAAAILPLSAEGLSAAWDDAECRVVLETKEGRRLRLPAMDRDVARCAWRCVFGEGAEDPEFSIGAPLQGETSDRTAPGHWPCYYKGPIEGTILGLILSRADVALGEIAYGGTKDLARRGLDKVPAYHSLAEMFPAKYAEQPAQGRYLGVGERVVIESLPARMVEEGDALTFARAQELAVRFGRTTPAERGYADLFGASYEALVAKVSELRDLVDCSRAIGVFKWLKQRGVGLTSAEVLEVRPQEVRTPHQVEFSAPVRLEELAPSRPYVLYGDEGPTDVFPASGPTLHITYDRGHVCSVAPAEGRALRVHLDDLGQPLAVEVPGVGACAWVRDSEGQPAMVDDVDLRSADGKVVGFDARAESLSAPEADPWPMVEALAQRFMSAPR